MRTSLSSIVGSGTSRSTNPGPAFALTSAFTARRVVECEAGAPGGALAHLPVRWENSPPLRSSGSARCVRLPRDERRVRRAGRDHAARGSAMLDSREVQIVPKSTARVPAAPTRSDRTSGRAQKKLLREKKCVPIFAHRYDSSERVRILSGGCGTGCSSDRIVGAPACTGRHRLPHHRRARAFHTATSRRDERRRLVHDSLDRALSGRRARNHSTHQSSAY